jgi:hypothetical protein
MGLARMQRGLDLWLNMPLPPLSVGHERHGPVNGAEFRSRRLGMRGCEGQTGWSIGEEPCARDSVTVEDTAADARALYDKLEQAIMPCFYGDPDRFHRIMRSTISLNGSFFNSERMLAQYLHSAYRLGIAARPASGVGRGRVAVRRNSAEQAEGRPRATPADEHAEQAPGSRHRRARPEGPA